MQNVRIEKFSAVDRSVVSDVSINYKVKKINKLKKQKKWASGQVCVGPLIDCYLSFELCYLFFCLCFINFSILIDI